MSHRAQFVDCDSLVCQLHNWVDATSLGSVPVDSAFLVDGVVEVACLVDVSELSCAVVFDCEFVFVVACFFQFFDVAV